ncbi:hypothetical protein FKW77_000509 [Venturia effusa]|uniref:HMA domain-containing protein n=1 Tax=Venturia effusa TaxID=50376 RepID=A0A517LGD4_9PEZI|nr:hypothetical protein FKW77_000509 [Venturia effusa]
MDPAGAANGICEEGCCFIEAGYTDNEDEFRAEEDDNASKTVCCSGKEEGVTRNDCQNTCCLSNGHDVQESCKDTCCPSDEKLASEKVCLNSCCPSEGTSEVATQLRKDGHAPRSECCEEKSTPCCDASCLDRIAIRECQIECCEKSRTKDSACAAHKKSTFQKYAAKLAALECICRALISLGQESCCSSKNPFPKHGEQVSRKSYGSKSSYLDSCDEKIEPMTKVSACNFGCCERVIVPKDESRTIIMPTGMEKSSETNESASIIHAQTEFLDVEKGGIDIEHIALSVTGMTCTGCETKLQRALSAVPQISNLKTSLLMARAEFSLDTASLSLESVIKHLERTTEFKCQMLSTEGYNIDVIPHNRMEFLRQPRLPGVNDMLPLGHDAVRIIYDPKTIGARSLIQSGLYPCQLAPPPADPGLVAGSQHVRNIGHVTLFSVILTIPVLVLAWAPLKDRPVPYGAVSLVLATVIQVAVAGPFYPTALKGLIFSRMIEMDLLIVLSTSAAYLFSVVSFGYLASGHPLSTNEFFETSTLLVTLIMIGRWVAALARQKAVASISVRSLQCPTAQLLNPDGTLLEEIDTRLLQYGDLFRVLPEHRVPTDGVVIAGESEIDESMLTGEFKPVAKHVGSKVIAGTINGSGKLIVKLTHLSGENTISVIAGMVDSAKLSKPKIQALIDRVASFFVPVIIFLTVINFVVWIAVGIAVQKKSGSEAAIQATTYAVTVLIVSCPCAIGLAVPMVIVIGGGMAAERGIIFKSVNSIEMACKATHVVFDKTGTLTTGSFKTISEHLFMEDDAALRSMVLGLVADSKHPVSAALAAHYAALGIKASNISGIKTLVGKGIEGEFDGKVIRGGNERWLDVECDSRVQHLLSSGHTVFCLTLDSKLCAIYGFSDTVRPEAAAVVAKLKENGVQVSLLSGDGAGAVQYIANQVGLLPDETRSHCSPRDKGSYLQDLLAAPIGERMATIVFVGDGTNDAVALTQATIGVQMNTGSDIAQNAADVVFMRPSLEGVLTMINISRAAVLRIKFNLGWSFVYNVMALLFASGALVGARQGGEIRIPAEYAGLGELVSVLPVIAIAVALRWAKV